MKTRIAAAIFAVAALLTPACEKHSWKETSQLFKSGHEHAEGEHGKEEGHAAEKKDAAHGEKPAAAADAHGEKKAH